MFKKELSLCLVLFGLVFAGHNTECFGQPLYLQEGLSNRERADELYQYVIALWPADEIWPQMGLAMKNIASGNDAAAQAVIAKLRTDFAQNEHLPVALHETGKLYRLIKKHDRALELHQYVIDNWPSHRYALWSLRDVGVSNIELGNIQAARATVDKVLSSFPNEVYTANVIYQIARHYKYFDNYHQAKELFQRVVDHWPEEDFAWWSHMQLAEINTILSDKTAQSAIEAKVNLAKSNITSGDMHAAEAAVDQLLAKYPDYPPMSRFLFDIAEHYEEHGEYEKARQLYQYVVDTWPSRASVEWSQAGVAMTSIALGDIEAAETAIAGLLAESPMSKHAARCLYRTASKYQELGRYEKAIPLFQHILDNRPGFEHAASAKVGVIRSKIGLGAEAAGEAIVDDWVGRLSNDSAGDTEVSATAAEAFYYAGDCYRQLGRYEKSILCYQRVVDGCPNFKHAAQAQSFVASCYEELKKSGLLKESQANKKIKATYEKLLEKYPTCVEAEIARLWLAQHGI